MTEKELKKIFNNNAHPLEVYDINGQPYKTVPAMFDDDFEQALKEYLSSQWIDVKDRLPEYYKPVIVDDGEKLFIAWRASDGDENYYTIYPTDLICKEPIKWMPLPKP